MNAWAAAAEQMHPPRTDKAGALCGTGAPHALLGFSFSIWKHVTPPVLGESASLPYCHGREQGQSRNFNLLEEMLIQ